MRITDTKLEGRLMRPSARYGTMREGISAAVPSISASTTVSATAPEQPVSPPPMQPLLAATPAASLTAPATAAQFPPSTALIAILPNPPTTAPYTPSTAPLRQPRRRQPPRSGLRRSPTDHALLRPLFLRHAGVDSRQAPSMKCHLTDWQSDRNRMLSTSLSPIDRRRSRCF
jgi:hypothetical protein